MADPSDAPGDPLDELLGANVPWWRRYSTHGEFPWSTMSSIVLHVFILIALAAIAAPMMTHDRTPPAVDVLHIGEEPDAAPGEGDGLPSGGGALEGTDEDMPEDMPDVQIQDIDSPDAPDAIEPIDIPKPGEQFKQQQQNMQNLKDKLQQVRDKLKDGLGEGPPGPGGGTGGGGGSGATGRAARPARWTLRFDIRLANDYLSQLDGLGAAVAFPIAGGQYQTFYNASSPNRTSKKGPLESNNQINWIDDDAGSVTRVCGVLGIAPAPFMIVFLPLELEERMVKLETAYNGLSEDKIRSTVFVAVKRGAGYDVKVVSQIPL